MKKGNAHEENQISEKHRNHHEDLLASRVQYNIKILGLQ